jgi:hypothetical protein
MRAAQPLLFDDVIRSCGNRSDDPVMRIYSDGCKDSCFGIRLGGDRSNSLRTAEQDENEDDPTSVISQAMNKLSVQEREQAYEDMHGVSAMVLETPELIAETLNKMEISLQKVHHKPAYDLAISIGGDYVRDPKLLLMFLRADRFNPELAANRLIKLLDWKLKIFGQEKLCQCHIGLEDLDEDSRLMLKSGFMQVLPERDSRGRVIIVISSNYLPHFYRNCQCFLQLTYYFLMATAEDETNQMSGVVSVLYSLGHEEPEADKIWRNRFSTRDASVMSFCIPLRYEAVHFCSHKSGMHFSLNWVFKATEAF